MICLSDISCFIQLSHCFNWCPPSPDLVSYKVTARLTAANWWFSQQQGPVTTYHGVTIIISCVMCKSSCSVTVTTQCLLTLTIYYIFSRFLNFQNIRDLKGFVELGFIVGMEKKWQNRNHQICIPASDPERDIVTLQIPGARARDRASYTSAGWIQTPAAYLCVFYSSIREGSEETSTVITEQTRGDKRLARLRLRKLWEVEEGIFVTALRNNHWHPGFPQQVSRDSIVTVFCVVQKDC